jgi:hypothetical protein
MKTSYINPQITEIIIDRAISLRLETASPSSSPTEPGSGTAGIGGEANSSGSDRETGWERTGVYQNDLWQK